MQILPQKLEQLLSKARASGLIILRGDQVVYSAGGLSDIAIDALRDALQRYWPQGQQHEFNRTVGLRLDGRYYLIFSKYLPQSGGLLGLVFPIQTPLIRVRQDMTDILRSIIENPSEEISGKQALEQSLQFTVKPTPRPDRVNPKMQMGWRPEQERYVAQDEETAVPEEINKISSEGNSKESESRKRYLTFGAPVNSSPSEGGQSDQFEDIEAALEDAPWQPIEEGWAPGFDQPDAEDGGKNVQESLLPSAFSIMDDIAESDQDLVDLLHDGFEPQKDDKVVDGGMPKSKDYLVKELENYRNEKWEDTAPISPQTDEDQWGELISDITFYLVPCLDQHHLVRDLSEQLRSWMQLICAKYGWELILLSVRPDYIKWTLRDFPESLIQEMLRLVRMETSKRIFRIFPELQKDIQEVDYWAPGYLVDLQNREFTTQALMAKVARNRLSADEEN